MSIPETDDLHARFDQLEEKLLERLNGRRVEFSKRVFDRHAELIVYVLNKGDYDTVEKACKEVEPLGEADKYEIWVCPTEWYVPWPPKMDMEEIHAKRLAFVERMKAKGLPSDNLEAFVRRQAAKVNSNPGAPPSSPA